MKWRHFTIDDAILLASHFVYIAYWVVLLLALDSSLGKSDDVSADSEVIEASKYVFGSRVVLILVLAMSKVSMTFLIQEIFTKEMKLWLRAIVAAVAAFAVAECLTISVGCHPADVLSAGEDSACPSNPARWISVTVIEAFLELMLIIPVASGVYSLQTDSRTKLFVVAVFLFRLIIWIPAILHMVLYLDFMRNGSDNIDIVSTMVTEEFWAALALICASTPILMRVAKKFSTTGMVLGTTVASTYGGTGGSYKMKSTQASRVPTPKQMILRPDQVGYTVHTTSIPQIKDEAHSVNSTAGSQDGILREGILREDRFEVWSNKN